MLDAKSAVPLAGKGALMSRDTMQASAPKLELSQSFIPTFAQMSIFALSISLFKTPVLI